MPVSRRLSGPQTLSEYDGEEGNKNVPTGNPNLVRPTACSTRAHTNILYECGTWSVTLREEHRLRVFEENIWT